MHSLFEGRYTLSCRPIPTHLDAVGVLEGALDVLLHDARHGVHLGLDASHLVDALEVVEPAQGGR